MNIEILSICGMAGLAAVVYGRSALREGGWKSASALGRFTVAGLAAVLGLLTGLRWLPVVVAYGLLCLAMVSVYAVDLWQEESARRRRVASLAPRSVADAAPIAWVVIAALSTLMLAPYVAAREQLSSVFLVAACALAMSAIGWRVATAPTQLSGEDVVAERMIDRAARSRRVGVTAVLAVGIVFVFTSFVNAALPAPSTAERLMNLLSLVGWIALCIWQGWYVQRLPQPSCSSSA